MNVLVTGGTGYIGSHTVQELLRTKHHLDTIIQSARKWNNNYPQGFEGK